jgi:hypothetical protein
MGTDRTKHIRHISVVAPQAVLSGSRFLRAPFQISKRAAGEATEFSRSGVELLGVISAARLECGEPPAETGELIRRQLGNSFGDFFDLHAAQYSIERLVERRKRLGTGRPRCLAGTRGSREGASAVFLSWLVHRSS